MIRPASILAILAILWAVPAVAEPLPPTLEQMLREAHPQERDTLENVAKRTYPNDRKAIDDLIDKIEKDEEARVAKSDFVAGWRGEGSLGGNVSTGNTDEWNFSAGLDMKREGTRWEHRVQFDLDLREADGDRTEERILGSYRARFDFNKSPWFLFGMASYERDRFQGISHRFTEATGGGYQFYDTDDFDWEVYVGPALRQTDFSDGTSDNLVGAFAATDVKWDVTDTLNFRQYFGAVLDEDNQSYRSQSTLTNNLYGRLSGRIQFTYDKETNPPAGKENTDTYSSLSLVYDF
jgi:putative salt-induced outer membrane protein